MTKKSPSIINKNLPAATALLGLILIWQLVCSLGLVPAYMLPSPADVIRAFIADAGILWENALITLSEAFAGLLLGLMLAFVIAGIMDNWPLAARTLSPLLVITQTVPTVALAPLMVLWFGYEMLPKVILVIIATFFPITIGLYDGFSSTDPDQLNLLRSMGAGRLQLFLHLKLPSALPGFFSGLRIATAYSVVGAVISEWLGGFGGLGVYMTRVRKAFAFDRMFAVIFLISIISLLLMKGVELLEGLAMPYKDRK